MANFEYTKLEFPNLPNFLKQMDNLRLDLQRNVFRAGVNAMMQVFKKGVLLNVPVHKGAYPNKKKIKLPGNLQRNIYVVRSRQLSTLGTETFVSSARQGGRSKKGDAFYWRFVEAGHIKRPTHELARGGHRIRAFRRAQAVSAGHTVDGRFFFRYAFNSYKDAALAAFVDKVTARIELANKGL